MPNPVFPLLLPGYGGMAIPRCRSGRPISGGVFAHYPHVSKCIYIRPPARYPAWAAMSWLMLSPYLYHHIYLYIDIVLASVKTRGRVARRRFFPAQARVLARSPSVPIWGRSVSAVDAYLDNVV